MNLDSRESFLTFTGSFLFVLLSITVVLAHWAAVPLASQVTWTFRDVSIGVIAATVMYLCFSRMTSLRDQAGESIGASLSECRWYDLAIMAILVGIVEEFLFRGFMEQWISRWNPIAAFLITNIVFGLLHALSPLYAILAGFLGGILSLLTWWVGDFNLLRPIIAHALYDFIGFMIIAAEYRKKDVTEDDSNDD